MKLLRNIWPGLVLIGVALVVFGKLAADPTALIADADRPGIDRAVPEDALSPGNDLTRLFLPHHARIASAVARTGRIPGWDPSGFGGRPLVGNPQGGLWYPPSWVAWRFWTPSALGWLTVGHLAWGGLGLYVLLRSLDVPRVASTVGASVFISAPYVLAQANEGHYPHVWAASWYSWAFWAAWGVQEWPVVSRAWLLPPILAAAMLTGHVQEAYYLILALLGLLAAEAARRWRADGPRSAGLLLGLAPLVAAMTFGLVAVELVPDLLAQNGP